MLDQGPWEGSLTLITTWPQQPERITGKRVNLISIGSRLRPVYRGIRVIPQILLFRELRSTSFRFSSDRFERSLDSTIIRLRRSIVRPAESTRYAHPNNIIPVSSDVAGRVNAITMASMFNRARTLRRAVVDPNE